MYVVLYCLPGYKATAAARAAPPSPTRVCDVSMFNLGKATAATWAPLSNPSSVCDVLVLTECDDVWNMDPLGRSTEEDTSHGKEVLSGDLVHLIQRPCYQRRGPQQDLPRGSMFHTSSHSVRTKTSHTARIGPHGDLTIVKKRKLEWYGHVWRPSGLAKNTWQGTMRGGRRSGSQQKRCEDNINEWTGLEFLNSQRAVENRKRWRELVAKSSVMPQRSVRVTGKWSEVKKKMQCGNFPSSSPSSNCLGIFHVRDQKHAVQDYLLLFIYTR